MYRSVKLSIKVIFLLFFVAACQTVVKAQITVNANIDTPGRNEVYELTIVHPTSYTNNWEDVKVMSTFYGTDTITIGGFFYDEHIWKIRFSPPQTGEWQYQITFSTPTGSETVKGSFICVPSATKGFLRLHPHNPFRLIFPDGTLFNGLGIEDCVLDYNGNGSPLDDWGFDGDFRTATYAGNRTDLKTYMSAYGVNGAGFNLFRWTTDNCSFRLYNTITATGNTYLVKEGMAGDTLVRVLRENQLRIWLTFFGPPVFGNINGSTPLEEAAIKRYIDYVVARYGAYTDIWELFNESSASDYYYSAITSYIRSIDPYKRLISVSDERPKLSSIDINSPHWYEKESELESDSRAWDMITSRKQFNKPIIFGEQGNSIQCWDPVSAVRMRIRSWTSFFAEGILIFWNASWAKDYQHPVAANIYLGPVERNFIKALRDYSSLADSSARPFILTPINGGNVRAYGLGQKDAVWGYFHHYTSHTSSVSTDFKFRMRKPGTIYWINPTDNNVINSYHLDFGTQVITTPSFMVDLAMKIVFDTGTLIFDESKGFDLIVYPNPAGQGVSVNGNFNATVALKLFDLAGRLVFMNQSVHNDERLSLPNLSPGTYIYVITDEQRRASGRLLIFK